MFTSKNISYLILFFISALIGYKANNCLADTTVGGTISSDTVWNLAGSPYVVTSDLTINSDVTLKLDPGVRVKFDTDRYLDVAGTLTVGDLTKPPVVFTSAASSPNAGDWAGIKFNDLSNGSLKNCIIEYAEVGLYFRNRTSPEIKKCKIINNNVGIKTWFYNRDNEPNPVINNCDIYNNEQYNYYVDSYVYEWQISLDATKNWWGTADPQEIGETIYDFAEENDMTSVDFSSFLDAESGSPVSGPAGETYLAGGTFEDTVLNGDYIVASNYIVQPDHTLNIQPGTTFQFMPDAYMVVRKDGVLNAGDISGSSVLFTSAASSPSAGDWGGIIFYDLSDGYIQNSIIEYAEVGLYFRNRTSPEIKKCKIINNNVGIKTWFYNRDNEPNPVINNCDIYNNEQYNYYVDSYVYEWQISLDATKNWWGTADPQEIGETIYDFAEENDMTSVDFSSFLDAESGSPVSGPAGETYLAGGTFEDTVLNGDYIVASNYIVQPDHTLNIQPGTTFQFMPDAYMVVRKDGVLNAGDISGSSVLFTSAASSPSAGDWGGIIFYDLSDGYIQNSIIEYAEVGLHFRNRTSPEIKKCKIINNNVGIKTWFYNRDNEPNPVINNCDIYNNEQYNYYVDSYVYEWQISLDATKNWWGTADPQEIGETIYDFAEENDMTSVDFSSFLDAESGSPVSGPAGETYLAGGTFEDTVLNGDYIVASNYIVQPDHTLNIQPGTTFQFMPDAYMVVRKDGVLNAGDISGSSVLFTSAASSPSAGDWGGIIFYDLSDGYIQNSIIEYAEVGLYFRNRTSPEIKKCKIINNNVGIKTWFYNRDNEPNPVINNCNIYDNSQFNYFVDSYVYEWNTSILNATNNYWGTTDPREIQSTIFDFTDDSEMAIIDFSNYLNSSMNIVDYSLLPDWQEQIPELELSDAVAILKVMSGVNDLPDLPEIDIDDDGVLGLSEAVYILQVVAGLQLEPLEPVREYFLSGLIFQDMTLSAADSPYTVTTNVRVLPGVNLTIEPGVEIKFDGDFRLWIDGRLEAIGTQSSPIVFSSAKSPQSPGDWQGIYFNQGATGNIEHSVIEYAYHGIWCNNSSPAIRSNTIHSCEKSGIYLQAASPNIENNTLQSNNWGISCYDTSSPMIVGNVITDNVHGGIGLYAGSTTKDLNPNPAINNNSIHDNGDSGANYSYDLYTNRFYDAANTTIDASNNWWGATALSLIGLNVYDQSDISTSPYVYYNTILDGPSGNPIQAVVIIQDISAAPAFISPGEENSTISYTLTEAATISIELYRVYLALDSWGAGQYRREYAATLLERQEQPAGLNTYIWNGKDANDSMMVNSAYVYVIKAYNDSQLSDLYDPIYFNGDVSIDNITVTPTEYNPYANEPIEIRYSLFAPAWVTIGGDIQQFILAAEPRNAGDNLELWDGMDGFGHIVTGDFELRIKAELLPENVIVLQNDSLQMTDVTTEAYVIIPAYGEISTVKYTLSKDASVSVNISDPNGNTWEVMAQENQVAGPHTLEWDGSNAEGKLVWPWTDDSPQGDYTIEITAVDSSTNTTVKNRANIHVYR